MKAIMAPVILLLATLLVGQVNVAPVMSDSPASTVVFVDPLTIEVTVIGENVTVNVNVFNVNDLYAWQAGLTFDPDVLNCTGYHEGEFLKRAGVTTLWCNQTPPWDNTSGLVYFHGCCLLGSVSGVSGSGQLGYLTFEVIGTGFSDLHLTDVMLIDSNLEDIPHEVVDVFTVSWGDIAYSVETISNLTGVWGQTSSGLFNHTFNQPEKEIKFDVTTEYDNCFNITIPSHLLSGDFTVLIDDTPKDFILAENATHASLYFTHHHSMFGVTVKGTTTLFAAIVPDDYPTIQEAINNATEGDAIFIRNGTYYENVVVNKTVSLVGEDREITVIDGNFITNVVNITVNNVNITDLTIQNSGYAKCGILVNRSSNSTISANNIIANDESGIFLELSENTNIYENYIANNGDGIFLWNSTNNNIYRNQITNNGWGGATLSGIRLEISSDNSIYGNNIVDNNFGIGFGSSSNNNIVSGNHLTDNGDGICFGGGSMNKIHGNFVVDSKYYGVRLLYGCSSNSFHHNNFINNTSHVHTEGTNTWDNGCEGNYWSNYNGTDLDLDGIGDTYLPWEKVDYYPLMNPYWNPCDINHDLIVDIKDILTTAIAYGSYPGHPNWNPHVDVVPDDFIDIKDILRIALNYGEMYPEAV